MVDRGLPASVCVSSLAALAGPHGGAALAVRTGPAIARRAPSLIAWEVLQRGLAAIALLVLLPLIPILYLLVRGTSRGPFLFPQSRPGLGHRTFTALKIRSMRPASEHATALGVTRTDPRITSIGRVLRASKLDEIPQLWNVVRGDMVLVGPRPIPIALDAELQRQIPGFALRYRVPPGITSLGQICVIDNGVEEHLVRDWSRRFQAEMHYVERRSVGYDLLVLGMTVFYLLRRIRPR